MGRVNWIDAAAGLVLVAAGIAVHLHVTASYDIGTLRRMGPGMVPMGLAVLLSVLGGLLALDSLLRPAPAERPGFRLRPFLFVLAAIASFSLTVRWLGLVPAVVILVAIATLADRDARLKTFLALAAVLAALAHVVFRVGLGMNLPPFRWPL